MIDITSLRNRLWGVIRKNSYNWKSLSEKMNNSISPMTLKYFIEGKKIHIDTACKIDSFLESE